MGLKIQLFLFALGACLFQESHSACCQSTVGLQQVRFGYPRYESCACSSYPSSFTPGVCGCSQPSCKCFRASGPSSLTSCDSGCSTSCGSSSCGSSSCGCDNGSVCSCFKALNCGKECGCGPRVYFPEVEYPVTVIDALGPFYYGNCFC